MLLRSTFPLLMVVAALAGCKDDDLTPAQQLQHRWTWQRSTGGIGGWTHTPSSTGQQQAIEFDRRGTVRFYTNGQLTRTDSYVLQTGSSIRSSQPVELIVYGNGGRQSYQLSGTQLTLFDEVYDGYTAEYQR